MLPLYDDNPRLSTPWMTYALITANVLVFFFQLSMGQGQLEHFFYQFAVVPDSIFADFRALQHGRHVAPIEFAPLLTSMFMHGGWLHLGGNMLFLAIFGDNVEDRLGHWVYLLFYLFAGVVASLAQAWSAPMSHIPSLGASGAIGGVLGAYIVLHPGARIHTLAFLGFFVTTLRVPAVIFLGIWFLMQSLNGLAALGAHSTAASGGTAWWAHVGGFLVGMGVGFALKALPARKPKRSPYADRWYSNR